MVKFNEDKQLRRADDLRHQEAERFAQMISQNLGLPYVDLSLVSISPDGLGLLDESTARATKTAVFHMAGQNISLATFSPTDPKIAEVVDGLRAKGYKPSIYVATENSLDRAWKYYEDLHKAEQTKIGQIDIAGDVLLQFAGEVKSLDDTQKIISETLSGDKPSRITSMLEILLGSAISLKASDIHLEPEEKAVRVRFRLDGILHDIANFDAHTYRLVISRIKLLSSLKLNVESARQDGRFAISMGAGEIDIRTSIIPGNYGEAAVMRILDPNAMKLSLENLNISPMLIDTIRAQIRKPNGLILNTGPTGSGKTTTLYTFLKEVNEPGTKIITIEDPIEYHVDGVVQTQVNPKKGYTFFEGLKSAMRQDPDIIMVGEIRDTDTATTAVDAALTGHLVFSTLHTNNAAGTIPRLIDLGVNAKVLGPALNMAMAQRLVRMLCQACKKERAVTDHEKKIIEKLLVTLTEIEIKKEMPSVLWTGAGCVECHGSGYKSRIGVHEVILVDKEVEEIIPSAPSEYDVWKVARKQKIPNMAEDGIIKVLDGKTTIEELERVVDLE